MRSSTVETRHGSGGTAMPVTGASRLFPAFLPGLARLARRAARLPAPGAPAAALAAGLALTLAATGAEAQTCTTAAAPTVVKTSTPITSGAFCVDLEDCVTGNLPAGTNGSRIFTGAFSDPGDTLSYTAALDDSSTARMSAIRSLSSQTGADNENRVFAWTKVPPDLLDLTPALPNPFETVVKITATDGCKSAHVYTKYTTLWRNVDGLSIVSRPATGAYSTGEKIQVRVNFARAIQVSTVGNDKPRLRLDLGGSTGLKWAEYASGGGTKQLTFEYTVKAADRSSAGVAVVRNSLEATGNSTLRVAGALLDEHDVVHVGLAPDLRHRVGHGGVVVTPSPGALVSNLGQVGKGQGLALNFDHDRAHGFRTGGAAGDPGFKLTRVDLFLSGAVVPDFSVSIHEASGQSPGTNLGTLSPPASLGAGLMRFTVPGGIDLEPATDYMVVVDVAGTTGSSNYKWQSRSQAVATGEDPGTAAGWSIWNFHRERDLASGSWSTLWHASGGTNHPVNALMAIHGYVKGATVPGAPGITSVTAGAAATAAGSLDVVWTAPTDDGGSGVLDYDLRYCDQATDAACAGKWVWEGESNGVPDPAASDTSATLTGLAAGTSYRVQIRAANVVGEGPWSDSGTASTVASTKTTNNAPVFLDFSAKSDGSNGCTVDTAATRSFTVSAPAGQQVSGDGRTLISATPTAVQWPSECFATSGTSDVPHVHDRDGDTLTSSVDVTSFPDNVRSLHKPGEPAYPRMGAAGRFAMIGVAIGGTTNVTATVTVRDPHGATKTINQTFAVGVFAGTSAPRFDEAAGVLRFVQGTRGSAVLPPAAGGDTSRLGTAIPNPYYYQVDSDPATDGNQLPAGLQFDTLTRTISGTPLAAAVGSHTVTYTADDADGHSATLNPLGSTPADTVSQTFTIVVEPSTSTAKKPTIDLVRVVSKPTHDSDSPADGVFDTYVKGDRILVDVEMSEPVEVTGSYDHVRLRLDIGPDAAQGSNTNAEQRAANRETAQLDGILHGGRTLRFAYTVEGGPQNGACPVPSPNPDSKVRAHDCDEDGIWVQTTGSNQVVFLAGSPKATIASAAAGVEADLTMSGLPTGGGALAGAERAKVDGTRTGVDGPVPETATVDGATLRVDFDKALNQSLDSELQFFLAVHGAGDVSGGLRNADQHPEKIALENGNKTLVLTIGNPARAGQKVRLTLSSSKRLKGSDNKPVPAFRDLWVTNVTPGLPAEAELLRASVKGKTLKLMFDRAMDEGSVPAGGAFRVWTQDADDDTRNIGGSSATIDGDTVTVNLAAAVRSDELARVSYAKPASNGLRDAAHLTEVLSFDRFRVETVDDSTPPTLLNAVYINHPTVPTMSNWTLYFDEALDAGSVPAAADFELRRGSATGQTFGTDSYAVANNAVTFRAFARPATVWLKYTPPATGGIRDLAGNPAAAIDGNTYSKATAGAPARGPATFKVDGALLSFWMGSAALDPTSVPKPEQFTLTYAGTGSTDYPNSVTSVLLEPNTVKLHLTHPVLPCDGQTPFTLTYANTLSGSNPLKGLSGANAGTFANQSVTNARHSQCRDGRNWLSRMTIGSVVIRANRPFATDRLPKPEWFTVTASGGPVTVTGAAFDPNDAHVLKLTLSREFAAGETVTASYRRPAGASGLWDVDGNQLGDVTDWPVRAATPELSVSDARASEGGAVAFTVSLSAASAAAVTVGYATSDGTAASGTDYTAASGTLTFAAGETSKTVEVATLADTATEGDETFALTLTSPSGATLATASATGTIADVRPALTAIFHGLPDEHDGKKLFSFEIRFSEEFGGMRLTAVKRALAVTGGRLIDARRTVRGQNRSVTARVRPSQGGDVTLALAATSDCTAADATCTQDGRKLSAVSATVPGPDSATTAQAQVLPVLSVADASADEGASLAFSVTLDAAATGDVTVDYATGDGTASAGADYTAASGTLTFAAGETAKTVEVAALADADAEGDETLTLTLSNASGASIGTASATGTVANVVPADTTPPAPSAAEVDGHIATVTFDEDLAPASTDWFNFQWTVSGTGVQHHPDSAWIADKRTVKLRLAADFPAVAGQTVTLKYEPSNYLRDAAGNRVAFFRMEAENLTLPVLTVADARAEEGTDATLDFKVRLNAAVKASVTVDYATSDGTAAAGEDYAATSGTLTFAPGETEKTVSVPIHDDSHDEGSETLSLTLSNAQGARIGDGEATGTIVNSDAIPRGWLARFGRTVAETHVDAVRDRMGASRSPGISVHFAGQPIPGPGAQDGYERTTSADGTGVVPGHRDGSGSASLASSPEGEILALRALEVPDLESGQARTPDGIPEDGILALRSFLAGDDEGEADAEIRALTADDVLLGTSFMMMQDTGTGASRGVWGRASRSGFSGRDGGTSVDGEVTGAMLGTDWKRKGALFGLILSASRGAGTYSGASSGEIDVTLTGLVPWAGREIGRDLSVWGALGIGRGDMTVTPEGTDPIGTGIGWSMAAAGADGTLAAGERLLGAGLRWHADALRTRTSSDAAAGLAATSGATTRLRLGVTADWRRTLESGATLGPRLEAGLRHDGGDAETGFGLEIGGGIGFSDPASGLSVTVDGRTLALHEDGAFGSWGLSLGLSWDPAPETKRGWSLSARQSLGGASSGGVDALLGPEAFPGLAGTESDASWSLEAAFGTGRGNGMVGSPYGRASGTDGVDGLRLGYRIEPDAAHAADASLDLWAEPGTGGEGREAGAGLQWRW